MLSEPVSFESNISVLIGKNGSGKSRFFQSIIEGKTQIFLNKEQLSLPGEIRLFRNNELTPILGTSHSHQTLENDIALFTSAYKSAKEGLKNPQPHPIHVSDGRRELMNHSQFMSTINYIATKTSKEIDQITDDGIKLHYPGVSGNPLGYRDVAATFNRYHKRINDNDYNIYRAKEKKIDVPNYGPEEFIKLFGREPWLVINEITNKIFDGKFHFPAPDLSSTTYDHTTPLLDKDKNTISTDSLSSGERTLLWLALTLFNTQYQNETLHSRPRLILLDEPDAFLHPKMVKNFLKF